MNAWLKRVTQALLVILAVAGAVRLAWELLRPAAPALILLVVLLVVLRLMLGGATRW